MQDIARLYYLCCELHPTLPDSRLIKLLPAKYVELITSATKNGISSGIANYEQLASLYELGAKVGIDATEIEYRSLLTRLLQTELDNKTDISLDDRLNMMERLVRFYKTDTSCIPQVRRSFLDKAPPTAKFLSGFEPLDKVLGGKVTNSVITIIARTGTGKSYISMAIAAAWDHGRVLFYDPENGEGLMLSRSNSIGDDPKFATKHLIFGNYDPDEVIQELIDDPEDGTLVILDSINVICGDGRTPDSGARYERMLKAASRMKKHAQLVLVTTHVKRGADGNSIEAAAGSSSIEKYSGVQLHLSKGEQLTENLWEYGFFCSKNRDGVGGKEVKFAFNYEHAKSEFIIEAPKPIPLEQMDEF